MRKVLFVLLFITGLLEAKVYDGVAVVVKNEAITLEDIKKEMSVSKVDAKKATDALIRQKLEAAEIKDRKITVSSSEVYDDIKNLASRNNMSISDFYDAVRESSGMSSTQFKEKIKQKLLSQKLYSAIAYSSIEEPSQEEIEEYYKLHQKEYMHPSSFTVVIYDAKSKALLQEKVDNPMFYSPEIATNEQVLPYDKISPELASLLAQTPKHGFTPIVPNGKGGFMSFYIKSITSAEEGGIESVKNQIINEIMAEKREVVLSDYFARLRDNADINVIRMPE
ncbi:SurA N-terminal domain-containing protein [Sulfurimonas sp. C5]|uniref:SurA N-terminal domain-containing protein n=1 Tax=Sulfurimonas sp. C5 TaxID=3036947 RepID=UPI0024566668|nr:SurA N-terminal domain-containing protein [Sulfurimonas sp. C5]MDH4944312.1 SurA N-terminal domain-containing protein [Sulfurimonas sp. C5]